MKLSRIWRILQIKETWSKICITHHILWKLNSIALLFNIQNIFKLLKEKMSSPKITKTSSTGFLGQWFDNLQQPALLISFWRLRFNNLQWAALLTSFWRHRFNNLQRAALLTSFWCHRPGCTFDVILMSSVQ